MVDVVHEAAEAQVVTVCVEHEAEETVVELSETSHPNIVAHVVGPTLVPVVIEDPSETVTWKADVVEQTDAVSVVHSSGGSDEYVGRELGPILPSKDG